MTEARITHGFARSGRRPRVYVAWTNMKLRCLSPKCKAFPEYGGRGIGVCDRWLSFENFLADMGEPPDGLTLDRIDGGKGYELSNCRWATRAVQSRNRRNVRLTTDDVRAIRAARAAGERPMVIARRYKVGASTITNIVQRKTWSEIK